MTEDEINAKERDITLVCLRGHTTQITTVERITSFDFVPKNHWPRCSQCGAYWLYATDGQHIRALVTHIDRNVNSTPMPRI